jgi:pSer/pThr/pTyr-binding forkhead associated (FHA) protein
MIQPNIYSLKYLNKEEALKDLKSKNVIDKDGNFINGTEAVVYCGLIILVYGTETIPSTLAEGYHIDIMSRDEIIFDKKISPINKRFKFTGYD